MSRRRALMGQDDDVALTSPQRAGSDADLDITPMIDVTFLLLIFFMVGSTMKAAPDIHVPPAANGQGINAKELIYISIKPPESEGSPATVLLGDGHGEEGDAESIMAYVREAVAEGRTRVVVKADREVPYRAIQDVAKAVGEVEGISFYFAVEDKKQR